LETVVAELGDSRRFRRL